MKIRGTSLGLALALALGAQTAAAQGAGRQVQAPNLPAQDSVSASRAKAIVASFNSSYAAYKQYAFGSDNLEPLSKGRDESLGGWGATAIDALDTAFIMGLTDVVKELEEFVTKTDYDHTNYGPVSLFETNIRHLGGLLSYYELSGKQNEALVRQAERVGKHLLTGWIGNNDIPYNTLPWNGFGPPDTTQGRAIIAEAGTLLLEFSKLSTYTGNDTYREHAQRAMDAIINSNAVFPGLYAQGIDPTTNEPTDDYVTWGGGSDSAFEYMIKYAYLEGNSSSSYANTWIAAVQSSITDLLVEPQGHPELLYLSDYSASNGGSIPVWSHLGCFAAGNWILGGRLLGQEKITKFGLRLTDACYHTYKASATGIGPESFVYKMPDGSTNQVTITNEAFYKKNGFDYGSTAYILRPEVLESVFYAYRATGDPKYREFAWQAFQSIEKYCATKIGALAALVQVNNTHTDQYDITESFLFAETYKYLWLTFSDPNVLNLDRWVFNTEAHPLRVNNPGAFRPRPNVHVPDLPAHGPTGRPQHAAAQRPAGTPSRPRAPGPLSTGLPGALQRVLSSVGLGGGSGDSQPIPASQAKRHTGFQKRKLPAQDRHHAHKQHHLQHEHEQHQHKHEHEKHHEQKEHNHHKQHAFDTAAH